MMRASAAHVHLFRLCAAHRAVVAVFGRVRRIAQQIRPQAAAGSAVNVIRRSGSRSSSFSRTRRRVSSSSASAFSSSFSIKTGSSPHPCRHTAKCTVVRRLASRGPRARPLVIARCFWHVVMQHKADIGFVDAHAESVRRHHHPRFVIQNASWLRWRSSAEGPRGSAWPRNRQPAAFRTPSSTVLRVRQYTQCPKRPCGLPDTV